MIDEEPSANTETRAPGRDHDREQDHEQDRGQEQDQERVTGRSPGSRWRSVAELPVLVGVALVLALVLKTFAVQAFYIPSGSMENTLQEDDRVLVNKFVYRTRDVRRGETVVFSGAGSWDPAETSAEPAGLVPAALHWAGGLVGVDTGETHYIKRVIGVGGDRVRCAGPGAPVTVNGRPLAEDSYLFVDPVTHERNAPCGEPFDVVVPEGHLWVMGDHRAASQDSRAHRGSPGGGAVPASKVVGRAFAVVWPFTRADDLPVPATFR